MVSQFSDVVTRLDAIDVKDPERVHGQADSIVLDLLFEMGAIDVVDAYNRVVDRAPWWAAA